jgi:hypothetical protein
VARFAVRPGSPEAVPTVTATAADVGSASAGLLLSRERRYDVHPLPEPIRLDARFRDKTYWRTLPVLAGFATAAGTPAASPTEARITGDRAGLVVAVSMAARRASAVSPPAADPENDRDGPVTADESLEIYIDPARRGRDYFRFAINPRNVVLDESSRGGLGYNPLWRHTARFGRVEAGETWDAEIRIPWEALDLPGPPPPGSEWGFQLVRHDHSAAREQAGRRSRAAAPPPETSQWADTRGDNTRSGLYGVIRFGDLSSAPGPDGGEGGGAPAPGFLLRGGGGRLPGRLPGFQPQVPVPEPPPPDLQ